MDRIKKFFIIVFCTLFPVVAYANCANDEIDVMGDGTSCEMAKFTVTTTNLVLDETTNNVVFRFNMSAAGTFYVDCGVDGTLSGTGVSGKIVTRSDVASAQYTCTYTSGNTKTIRFGGIATGYSTTTATIQFNNNTENNGLTPELVGGIDGSLGAIFPTLGNNNGQQPRFNHTFYNCSNMTGSIPSGLFTGIIGAPVPYMFYHTFARCYGLTGSIPSGLFGNLSGAPAMGMFRYTFYGCSGLTGAILSGLFGNLSGTPASGMFAYTFYGCSGLTGPIPSGLFGNLSGTPATDMFRATFYNCSGLTGPIPSGLFGNLSGAPAEYMFHGTFYNCGGLTGPIPSGLFGNLSGTPALSMFAYTFYRCLNLTGYIPPNLFGNISASPIATDMMTSIFVGTRLATDCSGYPGTIQYITGFEDYFGGYVSCVDENFTCAAGTYFPAHGYECTNCAENSYCPGGIYSYSDTITSGITACGAGLYAPAGMWESTQCGHVLNLGNNVVYLHATKKTSPALHVKMGNDIFYGNMTTSDVPMHVGNTHKLKIKYGDTIYSVYDDTVTIPNE